MIHFKGEKNLIDLVFKKKKLGAEYFNKINYDYLTINCSSNLMLPTLYYELNKKDYLKYLPSEFLNFIHEIYIINKNRNNQLMTEVKQIKKVFDDNHINHIFLKGSEFILSGLIKDYGLRMIGDIDILVSENQINKSIALIKKLKYRSKYDFKYFNHRHLGRLINPNKIFAVEIHKNILNDRNIFLKKNDDYFSVYKENYLAFYAKKIILNHLYNDYGLIRAKINLKVLYDFHILLETGYKIKQLETKKPFIYFFIMSNIMDTTNIEINNIRKYWFFKNRFIMKRKIRLFYVIDEFVCDVIIYIKKIPMKLTEFIFNKDYREHKIFKNV